MHPKDFMERWDVTRAELAQILNKSSTTIDHWFSAKSKLEPPQEVLKRLDEIHARFLQWETEDKHIPEIRQIYELIKDRQEFKARHED
jgi:ribosome-binding protein aMBF1 (putative translation factor)